MYMCVCVCLCLYHIFFIHFSVDGHFGCFHALAVVNSATMNIGMHVSFWTVVLTGYTPSRLLDHMLDLSLVF